MEEIKWGKRASKKESTQEGERKTVYELKTDTANGAYEKVHTRIQVWLCKKECGVKRKGMRL